MNGKTSYQPYQVRVNLKVRERENVGVGGGCQPSDPLKGKVFPTKLLIHVLPASECLWPHIREPKRRAKHTK